jgi:hypothetical protein
MSESSPLFTVPTAEEILSGARNIKPLQHDADGLRQFVAGFEHIPLSSTAAETLNNLSHHLSDPEWVKTHDAAHQALLKAHSLTQEGAAPELLKEAHAVEGFIKSQLPNSSNLKVIQHPQLQETLAPVGKYLQEWNEFLSG